MKRALVSSLLAVAVTVSLWWAHGEYGWPRGSHTREEEWDLNFLDNAVNDLEHPTELNANIRRIECADADKSIAHWKSLGAGRNKLRRFAAACATNP